MHSLLARQLKRQFGRTEGFPEEWQEFLTAVHEAYVQSDRDRSLLERSLDLSSQELLQANSEMRAVVQALPDFIVRLDEHGNEIETKGDNRTHPGAEVDPPLPPDIQAVIAELQKQKMVAAEYVRNEQGLERHYEARVLPLLENDLLAVIRDISDRVAAQEELQRSLALLRTTLDSTADGILVVDTEGQIVAFNSMFMELWRVPQEIIESRDDDAALSYAISQLKNPDAFLSKVRALYAEPEAESRDQLEFLDGRVFARFSMPHRLEDQIIGRVWTFRDITEQKRAEDAIRHQAYHDPLTELPNRLLFADRLSQAIGQARRAAQKVGILFIDLDRFKEVNDTHGHTAGDLVLVEVARRLLSRCREGDTVARIGGDEFVALIGDIGNADNAHKVAEGIHTAMSRPFEFDGHEIEVTASIGISLFPTFGRNAESLTKTADTALYKAKGAGRGRTYLFAPGDATQKSSNT